VASEVHSQRVSGAVIVAVLIPTLLASCSPSLAAEQCNRAAADWGPDFETVGAFETTAGRIRLVLPSSVGLLPPEVPDDATAFVCYVDGDFPKAPAPDGDRVFPNYDRGLIVMSGDVIVLVQAAYRNEMPIRNPG